MFDGVVNRVQVLNKGPCPCPLWLMVGAAQPDGLRP